MSPLLALTLPFAAAQRRVCLEASSGLEMLTVSLSGFWHDSDKPIAAGRIWSWRNTGRNLLASSFSEFDPFADVVVIVAARDRAGHHTRKQHLAQRIHDLPGLPRTLNLREGMEQRAQAQP
jgi:hypothetical protein